MNKQNSEKIFIEFPELFKYRENIRASLMGFGFAVDDGWFDLVYQLCKDIKGEYDLMSEERQEGFYVQQVKEKFAGLRFYTSFSPEPIYELIKIAEDSSYKICELCGQEGCMHTTGGWYKTLCAICARESGKYHRANMKST